MCHGLSAAAEYFIFFSLVLQHVGHITMWLCCNAKNITACYSLVNTFSPPAELLSSNASVSTAALRFEQRFQPCSGLDGMCIKRSQWPLITGVKWMVQPSVQRGELYFSASDKTGWEKQGREVEPWVGYWAVQADVLQERRWEGHKEGGTMAWASLAGPGEAGWVLVLRGKGAVSCFSSTFSKSFRMPSPCCLGLLQRVNWAGNMMWP